MIRALKARIRRNKKNKKQFDSLNLLKNQDDPLHHLHPMPAKSENQKDNDLLPTKSENQKDIDNDLFPTKSKKPAFRLVLQKCASCDKEDPKYFCPCAKVFYCGKECQSQHWTHHNRECTL